MKFGEQEVTIIRFIVPTPMEHPGYKEHLLYHLGPVYNWTQAYITFSGKMSPDRGQAWDKDQRNVHARWKQEFLEWLVNQPGIYPITVTNI